MGYTAISHANLFIISVYYIKYIIHLLQFIVNNMAFIYLNTQISHQVIQQRNYNNLAGKTSNALLILQTNIV